MFPQLEVVHGLISVRLMKCDHGRFQHRSPVHQGSITDPECWVHEGGEIGVQVGLNWRGKQMVVVLDDLSIVVKLIEGSEKRHEARIGGEGDNFEGS